MKKIKIITIIVSLILSFPIHFLYDLIPNFISSIIAPVNESIWEHMKIIFTSTIITSIVEYYILKFKKIDFNNFLISIPITSILGIIFYLILYIPIDKLFGHNLVIAVILLLITYIFISIVSYYILNSSEIKYQKELGIVLIILIYVIFGYLTYKPFKNFVFLDSQTNSYGIKKK